MSAEVVIPLAHHGDLLLAIPFVGPVVLIAAALLVMSWRDRRRSDS